MTIEDMVLELWNREKIRELTYAYGLAIESQDAERMASLFMPDGEVDFTSVGRGVMRGHDAIKAFYATTWPLEVKPFFTNHMIKLDGDRASGICSAFGARSGPTSATAPTKVASHASTTPSLSARTKRSMSDAVV